MQHVQPMHLTCDARHAVQKHLFWGIKSMENRVRYNHREFLPQQRTSSASRRRSLSHSIQPTCGRAIVSAKRSPQESPPLSARVDMAKHRLSLQRPQSHTAPPREACSPSRLSGKREEGRPVPASWRQGRRRRQAAPSPAAPAPSRGPVRSAPLPVPSSSGCKAKGTLRQLRPRRSLAHSEKQPAPSSFLR